MRRFLASPLLCIALCLPSSLLGDINIAKTEIPDARIVGRATLEKFFIDIFDATLFAPRGTWSEDQPFALTLTYHRNFDAADIVSKSTESISDLGFSDQNKLSAWEEKMRAIFPDVAKNSSITGIRDLAGNAVFYHNDKKIGMIADPEFSDLFFGIWLAQETSEPKLRRQLLGRDK